MAEQATSTIIGESILINGNLQGDEDLTVLGRVEGSINLTKTLNIEESGIVKANITVRNAIISGVVVGNITASDSVEITDVGRMVGDIRAPRVIIVDGARYRGAVDMGDMEAPRPSGPLPARNERALARPAPVARSVAPSQLPPRRSMPSPVASSPQPAPRRVEPQARPQPAPAPAPAQAPVLVGAKKFKKKVVVKKKVDG